MCARVQDAVEALLTTFVGRRKELEVKERLAARMAGAAPLLSVVGGVFDSWLGLKCFSAQSTSTPTPSISHDVTPSAHAQAKHNSTVAALAAAGALTGPQGHERGYSMSTQVGRRGMRGGTHLCCDGTGRVTEELRVPFPGFREHMPLSPLPLCTVYSTGGQCWVAFSQDMADVAEAA